MNEDSAFLLLVALSGILDDEKVRSLYEQSSTVCADDEKSTDVNAEYNEQ